MNSFLEYAVKSCISLTVLYLFYWLVLEKGAHFGMNRFVLLFSVIISMVLPAIAPNNLSAPQVLEILPSLVIDFDTHSDPLAIDFQSAAPTADSAGAPLNVWKIILIVYLVGAFIVFARLVYQAIYLHAVSHLSNKTRLDGYTIVSMSSEMVPFSYFNRIFIPASKIDTGSFDSIIAHEKSHLSQWHYIDLFIIEVISILQWFNPIVWLYEKSIKEVHEYLADDAVLSSGRNPGRYQALLVNQAMGGPVFILTNQFNQSLIKKRIVMMKKMRNSRAAQWKVLLIVPLIAGLLLAFASPQMNSQSFSGGGKITISGNVTDRSTGKVLPASVVQIKGTTTGTVTDAEGNYQIIVTSSSDELVISQVGYRTQVLPIGTNSILNVQLEPDILALDFSQGNKLIMNEGATQKPDAADKGENAFVIVEELPSYPGGTDALQKFLMTNMRYPEDARTKGIHGTVVMTYIIDVKGMVTGVKIMRGVSPDIDKEAFRLTSTITGWKPASQNGHAIPMTVTMPIEFSLNR